MTTVPQDDTTDTTTEAVKTDRFPDRIAYVGTVRGAQTGKWFAAFLWLTPSEIAAPETIPTDVPLDRLALFDQAMVKKFQWCKPGAIYAAEHTEGGISYPKKAEPVLYPPNMTRAAWQAKHIGNERARQAEAAEEKNGTRDLFKEQLEPARQAYNKLRGSARPQFIAEVVAYITRGY